MNGFIWNETLSWNGLTHSGSISTVFQYFLAAYWAALKLKRKLAKYILIFLENVDKTCKLWNTSKNWGRIFLIMSNNYDGTFLRK